MLGRLIVMTTNEVGPNRPCWQNPPGDVPPPSSLRTPRSARVRAAPPVRGDVMPRLRCIIAALPAVLWAASLSAQQPTGTIRGRVTDAATQQPLSGVTVAVGNRGELTQADGRYVITGVPAGTDSLRARLIGYARAAQAVTVVANDARVVDLALIPQAVHLSGIWVTGHGTHSP